MITHHAFARAPSRRAAVLLAGTALGLLAASSAAAQDAAAPAAGGSLQEVVVVARRVQERLQDVPLSVTALSQTALADSQITQVQDLKAQVSNVTTNRTSTPGSAYMSIRGLTSGQLPNIELDNRVGIYIDGVYIARTQGASALLADIDHVEVLKGPQGTLFGKNVTAGALNFLTATPTGEFGGTAEAGWGNFNRQHYRLSLNLPEEKGVSVRLAYQHEGIDGDIENAVGGRRYGPFVNEAAGFATSGVPAAKRFGDIDNDAFFVAVRYDGIDGLLVDYKFDYAHDVETDSGGQVMGFPGTFVGCAGAALAFGLAQDCGVAPLNASSLGFPLTAGSPTSVPMSLTKLHTLAQDFEGASKIVSWGHSLTLTYDVSDKLTVKSITAYRSLQSSGQIDTDGGDYWVSNNAINFFGTLPGATPQNLPANGFTPYCLSCSYTFQTQHQFSQEVQFIGKYRNFDLLGGLYYFRETPKTKNLYIANYSPLNTVFNAGIPPLTGGVNQVANFAFSNGDDAEIASESRAVFGRVTWHPIEQLDVMAGVRYTEDSKRSTIGGVLQSLVIDPATGAPPPITREAAFHNLTYEGTITYRITPDANVFVRYATAYLAGGLLRNIPFQPETTKDWEVGFKSEWLEHRLRFNIVGFSQKSDNSQLATNAPPFGALVITNVGSLETKGFEAEVVAAPVEGLTLNANVGYVDQKYSDNARIPTPRWTLQLAGNYDFPKFENGMFFSLSMDANYRSRATAQRFAMTDPSTNDTPLPPVVWAGYPNQTAYLQALDQATFFGDYWIANARLSLADVPVGANRARASLFVRNLFDENALRYAQNYGTQVLGFFEQDRTYGIDLRYQF